MNNIYQNNPNLKSAGVSIEFTPEQIEEYVKCANDPIYFLEHYAKIITLDDGPILFDLYDYQKNLVNKIHNENNILGLFPRQMGKCLNHKSLIKVRNKESGQIMSIEIGELYKKIANRK